MASRRKLNQKPNTEEIEKASKKSRQAISDDKGKKKKVGAVDSNDGEENSMMSGSKGSHSTRTPRGPTQMHCIAVQRVQGVKKDVELNGFGQPMRENGARMQSYIGVLVREKVKIIYKTWKHVPNDVKELIWELVNVYNMDPI